MDGVLFDIQRFSVHDGPGIRTTVFMKGCGLRCAWCHNPEGLSAAIQTQFIAADCLRCGRCGGVHDIDAAKRCPSGALKIRGYAIGEDALLERLLRDKAFYGADGGVTFSGGECLMQAEFVSRMCHRAKERGLHTCIDTSGFVPWEKIALTLAHCDLYLYDIKIAEREKHLRYTGGDPAIIHTNLKKLSGQNREIWIRTPVLPGINDTEGDMAEIADIIAPVRNITQISLIPYHTLGIGKYEALGMRLEYEAEQSVDAERLEQLKSIFRKRDIRVA